MPLEGIQEALEDDDEEAVEALWDDVEWDLAELSDIEDAV